MLLYTETFAVHDDDKAQLVCLEAFQTNLTLSMVYTVKRDGIEPFETSSKDEAEKRYSQLKAALMNV